ncbi:MAG: hypothetical protein HY288_17605 [Planctomycetia bacterium]|nr:hypothetical protein [Planctomycetia bacterium]
MKDQLSGVKAGDCVAIVFQGGSRRAARVDAANGAFIECWGFRFPRPDYQWVDPFTGEVVCLFGATDAERHDLWRRHARNRILQLDWDASDKLTDSQLERILAILNEPLQHQSTDGLCPRDE